MYEIMYLCGYSDGPYYKSKAKEDEEFKLIKINE